MLLVEAYNVNMPDPRKDWPSVLLGLLCLPGSRARVVLPQERLASLLPEPLCSQPAGCWSHCPVRTGDAQPTEQGLLLLAKTQTRAGWNIQPLTPSLQPREGCPGLLVLLIKWARFWSIKYCYWEAALTEFSSLCTARTMLGFSCGLKL